MSWLEQLVTMGLDGYRDIIRLEGKVWGRRRVLRSIGR